MILNSLHFGMKNTNDAIGRRTAMARSGSVFGAADTLSYLYNDRSEVTGANSNAAGSLYHYAYSFDNIGNRLTANLAGTPWTYTANNLNQYSAFTKNQVAETPSYDDDGNMLTRDGWVQTWNAENRLIKAEKGTAKLEFAYDYMGRRIFKKVFNGNTLTSHTRFVYDGYKLMEELDALNNNAVLRRYAWSPVGLDVPVSVYDSAENTTYYYHTDANKNITELTNASGAVVAHYEYSPFGKVVVSTGTYVNVNPFRFSSEYHDDETGLVYYNYRYYSPELGRWLSRDPIGEEGGVNLYGMVRNHLINLYDRLGLYSIDFHYYTIYYLLRSKCWSVNKANVIAGLSQYVDDNDKTDALKLWLKSSRLAQYHFPGSTKDSATIRNDPATRQQLIEAIQDYMNGGFGVTARLGVALHAYADTFGHEGFTAWPNDQINRRTGSWYRPNIGHADAADGGHAPDYPFNDVNKALEASRQIFYMLPDCCKQKTSWSSLESHLRHLFSFHDADDARREWRWRLGIKAKFGDNTFYDKQFFEKWSFYYEKALGF